MRAKKFADMTLMVLLGLAAHAASATSPSTAVTGHAAQAAVVAVPHAQVAHAGRVQNAAVDARDFRLNLSPASEARADSAAAAPQAAGTSLSDLLSLVLIVAMLVTYQLFRKHRQLRQQPFSL